MYCIQVGDIEYSSLNNRQPHLCMCYLKSVRHNVAQKVLFIRKEAMLCDFPDCNAVDHLAFNTVNACPINSMGQREKSVITRNWAQGPSSLAGATHALTTKSHHQPSQSSDLPHTIKHMSIFVGRKVTKYALGIKSRTFWILVRRSYQWAIGPTPKEWQLGCLEQNKLEASIDLPYSLMAGYAACSKWRFTANEIAGLDGLAVLARCLSKHSHYLSPYLASGWIIFQHIVD